MRRTSFRTKTNVTAPLPHSLPGVEKRPFAWSFPPVPGAPPPAPAPEPVVTSAQRKPSVRRKRPRGAPVPFGERLAKQVLRTRSAKLRFDRKKRLLRWRLLSHVARWLPRLKSTATPLAPELLRAITGVLAEDLPALELSHREVQRQLAAASVLRGERTDRRLKGAPSGGPAQGWSFDALPAELADAA